MPERNMSQALDDYGAPPPAEDVIDYDEDTVPVEPDDVREHSEMLADSEPAEPPTVPSPNGEGFKAPTRKPARGDLPPAWPRMDDTAFYGLPGRVVRTLEPHSEADPAGLLLSFLAAAGCAVGAAPHASADAQQHPARLNTVLVGETSRGRKGTTWAQIERVLRHADPGLTERRVIGGLGSGEALIAAVADSSDDTATDRRLLIYEPEFARALAVASREGSTLSATIRQAWDSGNLRILTRHDPVLATGAHVSVLGHITVEELRRRLLETEVANGFGNRFLLCLVRRSKLLPSGGNLDERTVANLGNDVRRALETFRRLGRFGRSTEAESVWAQRYEQMAEADPGGLVGALTARAEAQMLRLSVAYAGLDGTSVIDTQHLEAAWAVWCYCEQSAEWIFGHSLGHAIADRLYAELQRVRCLNGTQQRDLFARHATQAQLDEGRALLEERGLAKTKRMKTGGRDRLDTCLCDSDQSDLGDQRKAQSQATKATES
jgi:hypothetical protein